MTVLIVTATVSPVRFSATLSKRTPKQTTVANSNPSHASKSGLGTPTSDLPIRLKKNALIPEKSNMKSVQPRETRPNVKVRCNIAGRALQISNRETKRLASYREVEKLAVAQR